MSQNELVAKIEELNELENLMEQLKAGDIPDSPRCGGDSIPIASDGHRFFSSQFQHMVQVSDDRIQIGLLPQKFRKQVQSDHAISVYYGSNLKISQVSGMKKNRSRIGM